MSHKALLEKDHQEIDDLYAKVLELLAPATRNDALARLDMFWARLAVHIRAEHHHLFPAVSKLARDQEDTGSNRLEDVITRLRRDHDLFMHELAAAMKELRVAQNEDDPTSLLESVRERLEEVGIRLAEHNRIEEESVYALEDRLQDSVHGAELLGAVRSELANLPPRFG